MNTPSVEIGASAARIRGKSELCANGTYAVDMLMKINKTYVKNKT